MDRRRNPFKEIEEMFDRMGRQFEESMGGMGGMGDMSGMGEQMSMDVADHGEEYVVTADLPGFEKEDIEVSLREDQLTIRAEHAEEREEGDESDGQYLRKERRHQSTSRSVTLPGEVDEQGVSAQYRNGVLTVTLPKATSDDGDSHSIDIS
ncbi:MULTISPECIES: Hsp20/alpha crystallin family protein [Halorussus]|uniref:Hsp20/alpha crystallin family protein n=1 Tax=Halorussus TaxID=1070314 RepID=UPI00209E65B0|nr:Hsp20/alpha crystallin family protein [Halorussus vallis]USZ74203.1 Hsp20/alpha crystallin family protein [Halorussus vallis]